MKLPDPPQYVPGRHAMMARVGGLLLLALALAGCMHKSNVPEGLKGTWEATGSQKYAGSSFQIDDTSITFRRAPNYIDRNQILSVTAEGPADKTIYHIQYSNFTGGKQMLSCSYYSGADGRLIRFKYQPDVVWRAVAAEK